MPIQGDEKIVMPKHITLKRFHSGKKSIQSARYSNKDNEPKKIATANVQMISINIVLATTILLIPNFFAIINLPRN